VLDWLQQRAFKLGVAVNHNEAVKPEVICKFVAHDRRFLEKANNRRAQESVAEHFTPAQMPVFFLVVSSFSFLEIFFFF
jgi:hypothetical protein